MRFTSDTTQLATTCDQDGIWDPDLTTVRCEGIYRKLACEMINILTSDILYFYVVDWIRSVCFLKTFLIIVVEFTLENISF